MNILFVEDDDLKFSYISATLKSNFPEFVVDRACSVNSGVKSIRQNSPDLVLLDMTLPNFDFTNEDIEPAMKAYGGTEVLKQIRRMRLTTPVVVITQFETFGRAPNVKDLPQLDRELELSFRPNYRGCVYYHASLEDWRRELIGKIRDVLGASYA